MAQAVVRYLQVQYSERDGKTRRLIPAMFGIFGRRAADPRDIPVSARGSPPLTLPRVDPVPHN